MYICKFLAKFKFFLTCCVTVKLLITDNSTPSSLEKKIGDLELLNKSLSRRLAVASEERQRAEEEATGLSFICHYLKHALLFSF